MGVQEERAAEFKEKFIEYLDSLMKMQEEVILNYVSCYRCVSIRPSICLLQEVSGNDLTSRHKMQLSLATER